MSIKDMLFFIASQNKRSYNIHEVRLLSYEYRPFALERWISRYFLKLGITKPEHLKVKEIAKAFGIILTYEEKRSFAYDDEIKLINIDSRLSKVEQREQFFHELCHILRHCGSQLIMPKAYIELQEFDCKRFTKYAAMPFHLLKLFDFKSPYITNELSESFHVSYDLARERVEGIHRNKRPKKTFIYT
jgi:Zn-dependent peptidase ImmA (M78 family)